MARDIRTPKSGLDRNKYYQPSYVNKNKLEQNAIAEGVFYSRDITPVKIDNNVEGEIKGSRYSVTIETYDIVTDLQEDWYVLYSGDLWIVDEKNTTDMIDNAKPFKRRTFKTEIVLRR